MANALIAEDQPLQSLSLDLLLRALGFDEVFVALSADHAIEILAGQAVDFAMVEQYLATQDSGALIVALEAANIPTAVTSVKFVLESLREVRPGIVLLAKPITQESLEAALVMLGLRDKQA